MKESKGVIQGQIKDGGVKGSKTQAAEESAPEINPFLVEPVLVKLLKLVEEVSSLKELRKMCQTWDEFSLQELEERAFNGKVKAIDFQWTNKFTCDSAEVNLVQFMGDTSAIPCLFSSFKFNFPESWTIFSKHMEFFSLYPVTFVHLCVPKYLEQEQIRSLMMKFVETELWGNLKEIIYTSTSEHQGKFGLPPSSVFIESSGNNTKKLQKLYMKIIDKSFYKIFKSAFASGKYTNLTSMGLVALPSGNLDFPGLDLSKLTQLELGNIEDKSRGGLKFVSGLVNLAGNGMKLKNFGMRIDLTPIRFLELPNNIDEYFFEHLPLICSNFTQFLKSQSSTLERLSFEFVCYLKDPVEMEEADIRCKIHLPKFEALQYLKLWVDFQLIEANPRKIHKQLFGMSEYPSAHFPKLVNLTLDSESSLIALRVNPAPDEASVLELKRLEIIDYYDKTPAWNTSFVGVIGSVEDLKCHAHLFRGERLPWGDSLRSLDICNINVGVEQMVFFKLNHFKKLERISTMYFKIDGRKIKSGFHFRHGSRDVEEYLNTFKEATELPLTSIEFIGPNMEEEMKELFINYFPFPVEFQV